MAVRAGAATGLRREGGAARPLVQLGRVSVGEARPAVGTEAADPLVVDPRESRLVERDVLLDVATVFVHLLGLGLHLHGEVLEVDGREVLVHLRVLRVQIGDRRVDHSRVDLKMVGGPGGIAEKLLAVFGRVGLPGLPIDDVQPIAEREEEVDLAVHLQVLQSASRHSRMGR